MYSDYCKVKQKILTESELTLFSMCKNRQILKEKTLVNRKSLQFRVENITKTDLGAGHIYHNTGGCVENVLRTKV